LVKELVEQQNVSVDIQTQDNKGTPLYLASSRGHLDVVQFLVDRGGKPDLTVGRPEEAISVSFLSRSYSIHPSNAFFDALRPIEGITYRLQA